LKRINVALVNGQNIPSLIREVVKKVKIQVNRTLLHAGLKSPWAHTIFFYCDY